MEVSTGLVAGSHQRNELIVFRRNEYAAKPLLQQSSRQICQICGDEIGSTVDGGDPFIACNECAFPVCRTCYGYERKEGSQVCPQCKTRYKRLKGCPRVEGDEEEDDIDDVENEFNFDLNKEKEDSKSHSHTPKALQPQVSLLTNNQEVDDDIPLEQHALFLLGSGGYSEGKSISLDPAKDLAAYGYGSVAWKERIENWKQKQGKLQMTGNGSGSIDPDGDEDDELDLSLSNEGRQPLSRKLPVPSSQINPYRMIIIIRLIVLAFFFHYRVTHPVTDAYGLWLTSVICEIWFALSWILDQFPKWLPVDRETYLDRLSLRYENEGQPSQLSSVDIFVSTVDPLKEPPLVTANTILSILAVDYPVDKVSCYVSDDGAAMLTFEALSEVSEFAKKWVPFCKKFDVEPRAPEPYFAQKFDYLKDKVLTSFIKERRSMKREYEELKVRINALVAKAQKVPEEGWRMQDGSSWPGNNVGDHPQMIQVFLGQNGGYDVEGNGLPRLVYMSREKRPGFNHHKKAGAMNALVRVSAVLTNAPFVLNLDCGQYINNSKALREAMCFMMDPLLGKRVCFVQFPQRFDGIDIHDRYANRNVLFFDINMKGLDGIQGPIYVGTGCVFRRQALYGIDAPKKKKSKSRTCNCWFKWLCRRGEKNKDKMKHHLETSPMISQRDDKESYALVVSGENHQGSKAENCSPNSKNKLEKKFGQSPVFIASTFQENGGILQSASPASVLREAIHVISCGYEEKTDWGKEVGWIYGSVSEDILTGLKMHCHGWRSIYCMPASPAFKQSPPINLSESLHRLLHWALGSTQIFLSRHCPLWYGYGSGLKCLERFSYINATTYPLTSLPLLAYSTLPAICFLTGKFITQLDNNASLWFLSLFLCIFATTVLETRWSGVGIDEWWRNEQFWVICGVSAHLFAVFQCLIKILAGVNNTKNRDEKELFCAMKWTIILVNPTTLLIINIIGVGAGISDAMNNGYDSWGPLVCKLMFAFWVIAHLYPFLKGLLGRQNRTPTIIVVWSILLASVFSLLWLRIDPFLGNSDGLVLEDCGIDCN